MAPADLQALGDALAALSTKDAAGVAAYLKDAYGIEAPATTGISAPPDGIYEEAGIVGQPPSPTVDVILMAAGDRKISVIKVVRQFVNLGLKEAKDLVDETPAIVKAGVDRAEAQKLRDALVEQGATVELK